MCPACEDSLVGFELEGVEIDHCLRCGGTWLDAGELEEIALLSGASPGPLSGVLARVRGRRHGTRRCVRCPEWLQVVTVERVEIDRCPRGHGLWFDRGEVRRLVSTSWEGEVGTVARFFGELYRSEAGAESR